MTNLPPQNLLARESSPYLRQHQDNPVHWRPWSRSALNEAASAGKPILLSVGYAACHWCHVMAHESFENDEVAAVMNRLFVNIKVDREERPDIDQIYMAALTAMGEQGGWPLTIFLTPEGQPFWGGTYFPKDPRYGRPGFIQVLEAVSRTWTDKQDELTTSASALADHVRSRLAPSAGTATLDPGLLPALAESIQTSIDPAKGDLRGAPKFPNAPFMNALWANWLQHGVSAHRDSVITSLHKMLSGGIYDHLGGGLCRYSVDDRWLVPHFEKMLYDNAQLVDLATSAFGATENDLFRIRIEETIAWLQREIRLPGGGFASSLDADSEGEEGKFYLWTAEQIATTLGADAERFLSVYELATPESWEGDPILHRLSSSSLGEADEDAFFIEARQKLLAERGKRVRPGRDDKLLVDWNGVAIAAIAGAARVFDREDWLELAEGAFHYVSESAVDGRLPHSILGQDRLFPCMSTDYAAMIDAAVSLAEATDAPEFVVKARGWLEMLDRWHGDENGSGHYLTASDAEDVPMRIRGDVDEAVPSATAQTIRAMVRLAMLTSDDALYDRAVAAAEAALGRIAQQRYGQTGIICAAELARQPRKLVIVDSETRELVSEANRFMDLLRTDTFLSVGEGRSDHVELPGGAVLDTTRPGAWLCIGQTCLPPVRTSGELADLLRKPAG
ncbi:MAG: thioredoxin domain-containing protein [Aquamicrobium sp.]|nr:thioredoxin domain-containing protein [Aquamicrobium sp.]